HFSKEEWPEFNALVSALKLEASKASVNPPDRLRFNHASRSVTLDGKEIARGVNQTAFRFVVAVASGLGGIVRGDEIRQAGAGLHKQKLKRDVLDLLPAPLKALVRSRRGNGGGYYLVLPPSPPK